MTEFHAGHFIAEEEVQEIETTSEMVIISHVPESKQGMYVVQRRVF